MNCTIAERCEGKVSNLLASLSNLPASAVNQKIEVLTDAVASLLEQVEALEHRTPKISVYHSDTKQEVRELQLRFIGEKVTWFQAITKDGNQVRTLCLRGEV
jgi:hypothetical protein